MQPGRALREGARARRVWTWQFAGKQLIVVLSVRNAGNYRFSVLITLIMTARMRKCFSRDILSKKIKQAQAIIASDFMMKFQEHE